VVFALDPNSLFSNGQATAALVLGILGVFIPFAGVPAIIFGGIGISRTNQGASGRGLAIAGLVLGIIGCLVTVAVFANAGAGSN